MSTIFTMNTMNMRWQRFWDAKELRPAQRLLALYLVNLCCNREATCLLDLRDAADWVNSTPTTMGEALRSIPNIGWRLTENHHVLEVQIDSGNGLLPGFGRGAVYEGDDR